jgi:hypothetical protein
MEPHSARFGHFFTWQMINGDTPEFLPVVAHGRIRREDCLLREVGPRVDVEVYRAFEKLVWLHRISLPVNLGRSPFKTFEARSGG